MKLYSSISDLPSSIMNIYDINTIINNSDIDSLLYSFLIDPNNCNVSNLLNEIKQYVIFIENDADITTLESNNYLIFKEINSLFDLYEYVLYTDINNYSKLLLECLVKLHYIKIYYRSDSNGNQVYKFALCREPSHFISNQYFVSRLFNYIFKDILTYNYFKNYQLAIDNGTLTNLSNDTYLKSIINKFNCMTI